MKIFSLVLLISFSYTLHAQKSIFVRVYNFSGTKIIKGHVFAVTDTSIQFVGKTEPVDIPVRTIGSIKTKHSGGNNILIGSIVGASSMAILGAISAEPDTEILSYTAAEGAAGGAIVGGVIGAAIGGLTVVFKNSKTYLIGGNPTKWKAFQIMINENKDR